MDVPKPATPESLRSRADAAERNVWGALFEAVKIDKTVLAHEVIVAMVEKYQFNYLRGPEFFAGLGAAVAQTGGLHRSMDIEAAILGFAGRELGFSYPKIAKLIAQRLHREEPDPGAVKEMLLRHRRLFGAEVKT